MTTHASAGKLIIGIFTPLTDKRREDKILQLLTLRQGIVAEWTTPVALDVSREQLFLTLGAKYIAVVYDGVLYFVTLFHNGIEYSTEFRFV